MQTFWEDKHEMRVSWSCVRRVASDRSRRKSLVAQLASCLIYARALLEYVIFILWVCSVSKMLPTVKFTEDKVLTFLILHEKC